MQVVLLCVPLTGSWSGALRYLLVFQTPSEISINGLRVRYAELITLLSVFKSTVDMN